MEALRPVAVLREQERKGVKPHRVVQNNEVEPTPVARPFTRMAYLD
jgi:hypothetical protein